MHITKIELENIKSHARFAQEFQRGTTAIVGENGAGKTTIIEAVAWTLFDLLDYRKEDFLRRGAKKGWVRVTFESSFDERRYQVYRDTGTGYHVFDPELRMRIADKKEEVSRFLWTHLGVEPGTDLESLFRSAIGVPQGTFTAVFLETVTGRKRAFDKLLKVDEYRFGADKLRETSRHVELRIGNVRETIAFATGELGRFVTVDSELAGFRKQSSELSDGVGEIEKEVESRTAAVRELDALESAALALKSEADKSENLRSRSEFVAAQREAELKSAQIAAETVKSAEEGFRAHIAALGVLRGLEKERSERDRLRESIAKFETSKANLAATRKRFEDELERIAAARRLMEELKPEAARQQELERERDRVRAEIARAEPAENLATRLRARVADLRERYRVQNALVGKLRDDSALAANLGEFEATSAAVTQKLAGARARLESDRRFQSEIRNGFCPILSERCLNLKEGQTLEDFLSGKFEGLDAEIAATEAELKTVTASVLEAREAQKSAAQLEIQQRRLDELRAEGLVAAGEAEAAEKEAAGLGSLRTELVSVESALAAIGDPRSKLAAAEAETSRETECRQGIAEVNTGLERLSAETREVTERLTAFSDLEPRWESAVAGRDRTEASHRDYLANEAAAKELPERERAYAEAVSELRTANEVAAKARADFEAADAKYDRDRHQNERTMLFDAERRLAQSRANLVHAETRVAELAAEIGRLNRTREELKAAETEKSRLEKVFEATEFIRATLKKSAPLVARNYVFHVSLEAAQMFREITGIPERNLRWTEDYAIVLEENGYERPFAVLSGGEQMAAALSVRLALLKQLSDIRLAFFDEPTTNMDAIRRERLAEQISLISQRKTFDQLFVISHDDTFENFADSVVEIGEMNEFEAVAESAGEESDE